MFELFREGVLRPGRACALFFQHELFGFECGDAFLIGRDHAGAARLHDAVEKPLDILVERGNARRDLGSLALGVGGALAPQFLEQGAGQGEDIRGRRETFYQALEGPLDLILANRLAVGRTLAVEAIVVGMALAALALRPGGGQGPLALAAGDKAPQRKIFAEVFSYGCGLGAARKTILDLLEGLQAHQRFMLALAQRDAPGGVVDIARIDRLAQQLEDTLVGDDTVSRPGELRLDLQEPHDLRLGIEPARSKALDGRAHDEGGGLVQHQPFLVGGVALVAVADRGLEDPIAVHYPRPHAVLGLLGVLLAVVLRHARQHVLDKLAVGILAELDGRRFECAARCRDGGAQGQMRFKPARQARDIVDDDDEAVFAMLAQEGQHRVHTGPGCHAAGHVVLEDFDDLITLVGRELSAAGLLRVEPAALGLLLGVRDAGIDDGLSDFALLHRSSSGLGGQPEGGAGTRSRLSVIGRFYHIGA